MFLRTRLYLFRLLVVLLVLLLLIYFQLNFHRSSARPVRLLCLIITAPKYWKTRAQAVQSTWAPRCDEHVFISEYSNETTDLRIAPIQNISSGYKELTQKVSLALCFAYEYAIDQYDWFVKCDDDTYLIVENLRSFLSQQDPSLPITFGYNFKVLVTGAYHSGGASYVLSREALKRFYSAYHESDSLCTKQGPNEDLHIAACLRGKGVYAGRSLDETNRERFHPLSFLTHYFGPIPSWLQTYAQHKPVLGQNCCSETTISFHHVTPEQQILIDKMRYGFYGRRKRITD